MMQDAQVLEGLPSDMLDGCSEPDRESDSDERAAPRLRLADRAQVRLIPRSLDETLPPDHKARTVWAFVQRLDVSDFEKDLLARGSAPGRPATDPKVMISLWLYAASEGIGTSGELDRLCQAHDAYRWILGGVSMNYHTLSDFRVGHKDAVDKLITSVLTVLINKDIVRVRRLAQDGTRVRASAGAASFHRRETLEKDRAKAVAHVAALRLQTQTDVCARERAAAERAAREKQERIEEALRQLPQIEAAFESRSPKRKAEAIERGSAPRASTTDPEARTMRMADGGFRPAYNVQFIADTESRAIVGVTVGNNGSDMGQAPEVVARVMERTKGTGAKIEELLVDGGYLHMDTVDIFDQDGIKVYAPVKDAEKLGEEAYKRKSKDSDAGAEWRGRMNTDEAKAIYMERASTIETVHADVKCHRGMDKFLVRGPEKVTCVALWAALAYNFMHFGERLLEA